jgi:PAS domain-containing protein
MVRDDANIKTVRENRSKTQETLQLQHLRENEEKYRTLFETMVFGVVYQDINGKIISANPQAEEILGLAIDQMQGRTSTDSRWKSIHEDGSDFPGETHPTMVALKTGKKVKNVIMGIRCCSY